MGTGLTVSDAAFDREALVGPTPVRPGSRIVPGWIADFVRKQPVGAFCLGILVSVVALAAAAPLLGLDPEAISPADRLQRPSWDHIFGTDELGRDVFARVVYGARVSIYVSLGATTLGTLVGGTIGVIGGFVGGTFDLVIQRVVDGAIAIPTLLLALVLSASLGTSTFIVIVAIGLATTPTTARIMRATTLSLKASPMIEAAQSIGCTTPRILVRYIAVNTMPTFIIIASVMVAGAMIAEASLSFLGFGVPPPAPSWGRMLSGAARTYLQTAPWIAIFPGLALTLFVLTLNLLGDAIRDHLDPRLRGSR